MNLVQQLNNAILQNGNVSAYEKQIAKKIKIYVDIDDFYNLPFQNILNIVKNIDFDENEDDAVEICQTLISNTYEHYPDQTIQFLNVIQSSSFNEDEIVEILSAFTESPLLVAYFKPILEKKTFPDKDYDYEIEQLKNNITGIVDALSPFEAAKSGLIDILKFKINHGFDPNETDMKNRTVLHYAATGNHTDIIEYLINDCHCPVDPLDYESKTPLLKATRKGKLEAIKCLVKYQANVNACSKTAWYATHCAAKWGNLEVLKYLISHGANVDQIEGDKGRTPFIVACERGNVECAKYLLQQGANINAQDKIGFSALHNAAYKNLYEIVQFLIENGANINLVGGNKTPLDSAIISRNGRESEILLSQAGARSIRDQRRYY